MLTGHPVDTARAEFAKGLAEMAAGSTRQGNVSLRRARGAFARSGAWGAFAMTVTALAVAETGPSDGPELKGLFRAALARLRRAGALDAFQFIRATHRVVLLTRREPKRGSGTGTTKRVAEPPRFEPPLPYLMRGGDLLANGIVSSAREGDDALRNCLRALYGHAARGFVLMYACQRGSALVGEEPHRALALAQLVFEEAETLLVSNAETRDATPVPRQTVQAEAKLLDAQGQIQLSFAQESRGAAICARRSSKGLEVPASDGRCRITSRVRPLASRRTTRTRNGCSRKSSRISAEFGLDHLTGAGRGGLGTVSSSHRGTWNERCNTSNGRSQRSTPTWIRGNTLPATCEPGALPVAPRPIRRSAGESRPRSQHCAQGKLSPTYAHQVRACLADVDFRRGRYERALSSFLGPGRTPSARGSTSKRSSHT